MATNPDTKEITIFAKTNFRNQERRFGIKLDDRRRHMYLIGKTGMGKTTVLENMIIEDIRAGRGLAVVDPHGDLVEKVINYVPSYRINDVVYFNPADVDYPIGFNVLESIDPAQRHLVASGLMAVFTKIWEGVWSARMEYILNNSILALLEFPGSTMLGITRLLVDKRYRQKVIEKITDPIVKAFWVDEYAAYNDKFRNEAIAPIQNKVGQFLSSALIRNIVGQPTSTINLRQLMDEEKIVMLNLAKGRIGEDSSSLLGAMMITRLQLAAMSRVDIPEPERKDFFLYVDEFQNFATESFANILSEARKYRLDLILAHQYIEQLSEEVRAAVFGNVGTIMCFRIGAADSEFLAKEFFPTFLEEDLVNLTKFSVYMKLMIDGVASEPFSANTLPPLSGETNNKDKVIRVSRERYSEPRSVVEEKILRWSGVDEVFRATAEEENVASRDMEVSYAPEGKQAGRRTRFNGDRTQRPPRSSQPVANHREPRKRLDEAQVIRKSAPVEIAPEEPPISLQEALTRNPVPFTKRNIQAQGMREDRRASEPKRSAAPPAPLSRPQPSTRPLYPGRSVHPQKN
ncbi:MAG: type IV secretion system DNA-binding domain-containing protein [Patescibacteria group bacterium]|jgi:hypothetical protein